LDEKKQIEQFAGQKQNSKLLSESKTIKKDKKLCANDNLISKE